MNRSIAIFNDNLIRDLFAEKLDLSIVDISDVYFSSNWEEAIDKIDAGGCDIVFSDNSIAFDVQAEFIRRIFEINKSIRVIIILNKEDSVIARRLFKLGVYDCIVKNELTSEYVYEMFMDRNYNSVGVNSVSGRDDELRGLFWGNKSLTENFSILYRLNKDRIYIVTINLMNFSEISRGQWKTYNGLTDAIRNILSEYFRKLGTGEFFYNHFACIVLLFSPSEMVNIDFVVQETKIIINLLKSSLKFRAFAVIDREEYEFTEIHKTWRERLEYSNYFFFYERSVAFKENLVEKFKDDFDAYECIKALQQTLDDFDKNAFDREIVKLLDLKPKVSDVKGVIDFFLTLLNEIKKLEIQYDVAFADDNKFKAILRKGHLRQAVAYCKECVKKIMEGISEKNRMSIHIKKYLENHIAENVTLKDLSENFNFEYNYSSKYFNKIMGTSFKRYFTNLRLETAMNLLKTTKYKCYEIATMCGYKNYEHFSRMFYKKYNIWPKQIK